MTNRINTFRFRVTMDHRFFTLQKQVPTLQHGTQKSQRNSNRKALRPIKKPGESNPFLKSEQNQHPRAFSTNLNDWAFQQRTFVDPPEKMSTLPLPPQETEIQIFQPRNSHFIEPSDDELQELPDIPIESRWPDLTQNQSFTCDDSYDSIIED